MFKILRLCFLFVLWIFLWTGVFAQGASNKGTDFWLGYGKHTSTGQMVVYITSDVNTTATVSIANLGFQQIVSVPANGIVSVDIPTTAHLKDEGSSLNGIHITSIKPIIVYAHIYASSVSGATLVLPVNALGKEYLSINYKQISNSKGAVSWFFVVAVEDDTQVEITPSQNTQKGWEANKTYTVNLKKGEIYNVLAKATDVPNPKNTDVYSYGDDLTGSRVKSVSVNGACKKVAVFSGSSKLTLNCLNYVLPTSGASIANPGSADNLFQQAYPVSTWGKNFITIPQKERNFVIYRVVKSDPTAKVTINGNAVNFPLYYDFESKGIEQISADKPIQVVQYAVTQGKGMSCTSSSGDVGDPEMIYLNPLEQTLTKITMYSTGRFKILKHFINVVIKNDGLPTFTLDGVNVESQFTPVPNTEYSYAQLSVTEGTHNLVSDVGFNAIAYGFGSAESYGYAAGANLTAFGIEPEVAGNSSSVVQTGCVGVSYNFTLKVPYKPSQIQLDEGDGLKVISLDSLPDIVKDGNTTYVYALVMDKIYDKPGTHTFRVVTTKPSADACGSGDEFITDFMVNPIPVADFKVPLKVCLKDSVDFSFINPPNQNIIEYKWDLNGVGSSVANPKYAFDTPGFKTIKLSVKSEDGCWSDTKQLSIEVIPLPVAKFSVSNTTCLADQIQFTDESTAEKGNITKWEWNFGEPSSSANTSSLQNPTHRFSALGKYTITLKVTTELGCENIFTKEITIHAVPVVDFESPDICLKDATASFINKSTISDGVKLTYLWNFGDERPGSNNTSTDKNANHTYIAAKNYTVSLTVTSEFGCSATLSKTFTVNGSTPKAEFEVQNKNNLCSDKEVVFEDLASVDFGEITKIEWIYDASKPSEIVSDENPANSAERILAPKLYKHIYPSFFSPAMKKVTVIMNVYSGTKCISVIQKEITLKAIPKVDFDLSNSCLPNGEASFVNLSTFDGSEDNLVYEWNFGDGKGVSSNTQRNPTYKYTTSASYEVTLRVIAPNGCEATLKKMVKVDGALPQPQFNVLNADNLCSDQPVSFIDNSTISFGKIKTIEWDFDVDDHPGDPLYKLSISNPLPGSTTLFSYPKFSSPEILNKNVRIKTYGSANCITERIQTITLKAVPNVDFAAIPPVCQEVESFQFTQASETSGFKGTGKYSGKGVAEDGTFSPATAGVGVHAITYTFWGDNGCSDTKIQDVIVYPTPQVDAGTDKIILTGGEVSLDARASGLNLSYKWSPTKDLSQDDVLNPIASPTKDATYTLTVSSQDGCVAVDEVTVKVLQFPDIPNTFTPNGDGINDTWDIKYLSSYPNCTIKVFNRYGKEVFSTLIYQAWDGKLNGTYLPEGMYYYIITAKDGELKYTGSLMLIR